MRTQTIEVPDWAHPLLRNAEVDGMILRITKKLDRADYVSINQVLEGLGGKWNRKLKGHVFPEDPRALIERAMGDGSVKVEQIVDVKKTLGQFDTPLVYAAQLINTAEIEPGRRVLEPSAGTGRLLQFIPAGADIAAIEIDPERAARLTKEFPAVNVICADFLECKVSSPFDRIVMNPPFSNGDDIKHILHAMTFLAPTGRLVAICANGPRQHEKLSPFVSSWSELPEKAFQESGTGVNAALIEIQLGVL